MVLSIEKLFFILYNYWKYLINNLINYLVKFDRNEEEKVQETHFGILTNNVENSIYLFIFGKYLIFQFKVFNKV